MGNRVVAFRVSGEDWETFRGLVDASGGSVQGVLRGFISACVQTKSVEVRPVRREVDGSDLADEFKLRNDLRRLRGYLRHGNYEGARGFFGEVTLHLRGITNSALLEEARRLGLEYLKWVDERDAKAGEYEAEED